MKSINIETEGLNNTIGKIEEKVLNISNIFDEIEKKMQLIDGSTDVWKSNAQASVYRNYKTISNNFPVMVEQLNSYISFLKMTVDNYKRGENTINDSINNNESDLSIN